MMLLMFSGLIFFHFQKLSAERAGLAELNIVQKEWMAVVPYLLSLEYQKVCTHPSPLDTPEQSARANHMLISFVLFQRSLGLLGLWSV